ncbi:MAG TPA: TIGR04282 family arsenosugar biosynthesis glycosyltransferase [Magnetovibrio sp.]
MKRHLVLMAKAPRLGTVKSRLAAEVGPVKAWAFYRRCLSDTARKLHDPRWQCWLMVTPDTAAATLALEGWRTIAQGGGDLGARMLRPMQTLPPGLVVVVGADIPAMTAEHIAAAFEALGENDWVFGPASDGGFWLVGAKRRPRLVNPFKGVRWSSEHALGDTLANLPDGARVGFVETLNDVDVASDLPKVPPAIF